MYRQLGRILFILTKPMLRRYLKGTRRSYVFIVNGNKVLMVQNWLGNGGWSLPGGGAHTYETNEEAAARELSEEIGVTITADELTPFYEGVWSSCGFSYDYHCSYVKRSDLVFSKRPFEITDTRYFTYQELRENTHVAPEIITAVEKLMTLLQL